MYIFRYPAIAFSLLLSLGCGESRGQPADAAVAESGIVTANQATLTTTCEAASDPFELADDVRETSGMALSRVRTDILWTHNDAGNDADLFALNGSGEIVGRVSVDGAEAIDWEDIESGPCPEGDCLFIADIGDNDGEREQITVYRLPEPDPVASSASEAVAIDARFPDDPQDAESLIVLPTGELFIVTKGRHGSIGLYRFPEAPAPGEGVVLEHVRELWPEPSEDADRVTAATVSREGRWVGLLTHRQVHVFTPASLIEEDGPASVVMDIDSFDLEQPEALVISDDGTLWISSEAENRNGTARLLRLACTLPAGQRAAP